MELHFRVRLMNDFHVVRSRCNVYAHVLRGWTCLCSVEGRIDHLTRTSLRPSSQTLAKSSSLSSLNFPWSHEKLPAHARMHGTHWRHWVCTPRRALLKGWDKHMNIGMITWWSWLVTPGPRNYHLPTPQTFFRPNHNTILVVGNWTHRIDTHMRRRRVRDRRNSRAICNNAYPPTPRTLLESTQRKILFVGNRAHSTDQHILKRVDTLTHML